MQLKTQEIAAQMVVPPKFLNDAAHSDRLDTVRKMIAHSLTDFLVVNGTKVLESDVGIEPSDPSMRGAVEINARAMTVDDLTLLALVAKQERHHAALIKALMLVNDLPWWKVIWWKLRGRRLVDYQ